MLIDLATHGLFDNKLNSRSTVVDLGANEGAFAIGIQRRFGCKVIAVEPSEELCARISRNSGVAVVQSAISGSNGIAVFHVAANSQASSILPNLAANCLRRADVRTITLETLFEEYSLHRVDLLKIDIEGSEVELFDSTTDDLLKRIAQISIEFHDFNGTIGAPQADRIEQRLLNLGFGRIALSRTNRENVLFYQPKECGVSRRSAMYSRYVAKNIIGFRRWRARQQTSAIFKKLGLM